MGGIQGQWVGYCPTCIQYNESTGVCNGFHFKVKTHPKRFDKYCEGRIYSVDPQRKESGDESHPIGSHADKGPHRKGRRKVDVLRIEHPAESGCAFCQKKEQLKEGVFHFGRVISESTHQDFSRKTTITKYRVLGSKTLQFCALCLGKLREAKKRLVRQYVWSWLLGGLVLFIALRLGMLTNEKSVFGIIYIIFFIGLTLLGLVLLVRSVPFVFKNIGDILSLSYKTGNESFLEEFLDEEAIRLFKASIVRNDIGGYTYWTRQKFKELRPDYLIGNYNI